jgi:hypothetical protein
MDLFENNTLGRSKLLSIWQCCCIMLSESAKQFAYPIKRCPTITPLKIIVTSKKLEMLSWVGVMHIT